jgi:DNA-binding MarR family transcriptional regulator
LGGLCLEGEPAAVTACACDRGERRRQSAEERPWRAHWPNLLAELADQRHERQQLGHPIAVELVALREREQRFEERGCVERGAEVRLPRSGRATPSPLGTGAAAGIRPAHLQVFGAIKADGSRLTDLAGSAGMSLSAMAELVDDLESLGYLQRRGDPADGRAKLVCLTASGWEAIRTGRGIIERIEADWAKRIGPERFEALCRTMQELLDELDPRVSQQYVAPSEKRKQVGP